jgi:hypothetical protein
MKRQIYFFTGALLFTTAMLGCGQNLGQSVNDIDSQEPVEALSKPFETLGTTDESVAFDDIDIAGTEEDGVNLSKAGDGSALVMATSTGNPILVPVNPVLADPPPDVSCPRLETYFLKVRWGQIFRNRGEERDEKEEINRAWMNWSGSLTASEGSLTLVKTILFERNGENVPEDMVHPRTNRKVIAFDSYTKPHYDGLIVKYQYCASDNGGIPVSLLPADGIAVVPTPVLPADDILPVPSPRVITFSAPGLVPEPFSKTWTLAELKRINQFYENVDANHDAFQIVSLMRDERCKDMKGEIHGVWFKVNERFGQIKGRVVSANGDAIGHIKGFYGKANDAGEQKIVAKFIAHDGTFKGIIIGTGKDGTFSADIFNRERVKVGTITGRYKEGNSRRKGTFSAIFELVCEVPVVPATEPTAVVIPE